MRRAWIIVAVCLATVVSARAHAQPQAGDASDRTLDATDAEARDLFERGRDALSRGDYETALGHFRRAYELSRRPELLFNVGVAADRLRRDAEAIEAFEQYIRERPDATNREEVESRLRVLRNQRAAAEPEQTPAPAPMRDEGADGPGLLGQWWFWAAVVVLAGGAALAIVVLTADEVPEEPLPGSLGDAVMTLRW